MYSVCIVENPLLDYVVNEDYSWLERFGAKPGTMQLVEYERFREVISSPLGFHVLVGGSGANTARAIEKLLGEDSTRLGHVSYSGGVGADEQGERFRAGLEDLGIETGLAVKEGHTGVAAIVVTPDHERTMFTNLGACRDYSTADLRMDMIDASRFFYSTGYMWNTEPQQQAVKTAVEEARSRGLKVCFDLADSSVVDRYYEDLGEWIRGRVDVLFANRDELSRITGCSGSDAEIIRRGERLAPVVAMKIGKGGCLVLGGGRLVHIPGERVACVDVTAAGDSFAAGFIYGLLMGRELVDCGRLGNRVASRIVTVEGARYDLLDRSELLAVL
jgi:fructokinase